jgi:hypothetical protein
LAYNTIFGRTTLNELKAVTSTPHLIMKFPIDQGVRIVKGDQREARPCYNMTLKKTFPDETNLREKSREDGK